MTDYVRVDGKFFARAGERFKFNGVTYGTFEPRDDGTQFPDRAQIKSDFAAMRDAGFTVVRTYTEPPDDLLELAADWGLSLLVGPFWPDWRYQLGSSRRQRAALEREGVAVVRRAARRLAGCDAVVALCLGNEVPCDVVRWVGAERVSHLISELASAAREEDPDRLVTYANYPSSEYLQVSGLDFVTFNVFLERRDDLRRYLTRLHHIGGDLPVVVGELGHDSLSCGEDAQARALDWQLETALERGVAGTCVFSWTDDWWVGGVQVEGWEFGLTRRDRSPRLALDVAGAWNGKDISDLRPGGGWPSISVVVCAFNAGSTLDECLRHTCSLDYPGLDIVVVDDGSTDATGEIAARHPRARLVTQRHAGLSVARNTGRSAALGDLIAYLDADAFPAPEWPYYLALGLDGPQIGAVGGPNVVPPSDPPVAQLVAKAPGGPVHVLLSDDRAEHIPGCNMAFRNQALDGVGGFDPVYMAAGDDVDVCWKILDSGWEIGFHPAALVWHHRRGSLRAYLRQQVGYGKADALVAARHPDRFNALGAARWKGRIYGPVGTGRQRIYRGAFGASAFQSVYRGRVTLREGCRDIAAPVALALTLTLPLGLLARALALPGALGVVVLVALVAAEARQVATAPPGRSGPGVWLGVGLLSCAQPIARAWGRARAARAARQGLLTPRVVIGSSYALPGGVVALHTSAARQEVAAALLATTRRAGLTVTSPTGWEDHDLSVMGSLLVAGDIVTSGHPDGAVQVRVRRRVRLGSAVAAVAAVGVAALLDARVAALAAAITVVDVVRGTWRTGLALRRLMSPTGTAGARQIPLSIQGPSREA
jgi:glycosyltransferase involved in cell wall biosynthesis